MIGEKEIRTRIAEVLYSHVGSGWDIKSIARYTIAQRAFWIVIVQEDGALQECVFSLDLHGVLCYEQPIYRAGQYE